MFGDGSSMLQRRGWGEAQVCLLGVVFVRFLDSLALIHMANGYNWNGEDHCFIYLPASYFPFVCFFFPFISLDALDPTRRLLSSGFLPLVFSYL